MQAHLNACQREHRELCYVERCERDECLAGLMETFDKNVLRVLEEATAIVHDGRTGDAAKLAQLRSLFPAEDTATGVRSPVDDLRSALAGGTSSVEYNKVLESRSIKLQIKVSPILRTILLRGDAASSALLEALQHFRHRDGAVGAGAPQAFLDADEHPAVAEGKRVTRVSLYKVFLFVHVARAIKAGTLNLEHSIKYRPLDDYLIDKGRWQRERNALIERCRPW